MPINPKITYDNVANLPAEQQAWRKNKWVDDSVTEKNEELQILKQQYKALLEKLQDIETRNKVRRQLYS